MRGHLLTAGVMSLMIWTTSVPVRAQSPAILEPFWSYSLFGDRIGYRSMEACDIGFDDRAEFVFDDRDRLILVGWPTGSDEPIVLGSSHSLGEYVNDIAVWFDGTGWRAAVLFGNENIAVFTLPSFEIVASGVLSYSAIRLDTADVMNGTEHEIIVTGWERSAVHDSATIDELLSLAVTGSNLVAGNVDADPAPELVFTGGAVIEIRNGSPLLEWTVPMTGDRLILAELDGAPPSEIVMGDNGASVAAYSFGNPTALWGFADDSLELVSAADLTRDGREEVLVLGGWHDELMGLHPMLGLPIWAENYEDEFCQPHMYTSIAAGGDLNGDGDLDLLWPSGDYQDRWLCAADAWSGDLRWKGEHHEGPVHAIGAGDLEGDGTIERLGAVSGTRVAIFDAGRPTPRDVFSLWGAPGYSWYDEIESIATGDVDRDGVVEIVVGVDGYYGGAVHEFDPSTLEHERGSTDVFSEVTVVDIADLDGDNWPEIAVGGGTSTELRIGAVEGATAELEWWVPAPGQGRSIQGMQVGEVDGDPALEIVAVSSNGTGLAAGSVIVVDTDTQEVRWSPTLEFYGLDLVDLDHDGIEEILTGTDSGELVAFEAVGMIEELWQIPVGPHRLEGIRVYHDHLDRPVAAVSTDGALVGVDLSTARVSWTTPVLGDEVGVYDGFQRVEIPGRKTPALLVGTAYSIQELRPGDLLIFGDGFEGGDTSWWSATAP